MIYKQLSHLKLVLRRIFRVIFKIRRIPQPPAFIQGLQYKPIKL